MTYKLIQRRTTVDILDAVNGLAQEGWTLVGPIQYGPGPNRVAWYTATVQHEAPPTTEDPA